MSNTKAKLPKITILKDRSLSVRLITFNSDLLLFIEAKLDLNEDMIVGIVLNKVIKPPAATAPAPICFT